MIIEIKIFCVRHLHTIVSSGNVKTAVYLHVYVNDMKKSATVSIESCLFTKLMKALNTRPKHICFQLYVKQ